jgi:hypothetical protein
MSMHADSLLTYATMLRRRLGGSQPLIWTFCRLAVRTPFVTSQGSPYARFQRALATGNLLLIRAAAAELPRVDLGDALSICVAIRQAEPERFERAALRWIARFCVERRDASLADLRAAAWAFERMGSDSREAVETLRGLCR